MNFFAKDICIFVNMYFSYNYLLLINTCPKRFNSKDMLFRRLGSKSVHLQNFRFRDFYTVRFRITLYMIFARLLTDILKMTSKTWCTKVAIWKDKLSDKNIFKFINCSFRAHGSHHPVWSKLDTRAREEHDLPTDSAFL